MMFSKKRLAVGALALGAWALGLGVAAAQGGAEPPPADPNASGTLTQQVQLTPEQMMSESVKHVARMQASRTQVRRMLAEARAERDVVKTLCLDDKLNQLDVALKNAEERKDDLQRATERNDADQARHEFTILSVLRQRSDQLMSEANECIGREAGIFEDSAVEYTVDPDIPDDDELGPNFDVVVEPPACASCFQ